LEITAVVTRLLDNHLEESAMLPVAPAVAFEFLDDFEALGAHMMRGSWMMAGSSMRYEFDESRGKRVGALVRLRSSFLGMSLQIEECVLERTPPLSKVWETVGSARMIVMDAYRMGFTLTPSGDQSILCVFIDYAKPLRGLSRWLADLAAERYARWCVRGMIAAAVTRFGTPAPTGAAYSSGHATNLGSGLP
jgi:hypothetical protein